MSDYYEREASFTQRAFIGMFSSDYLYAANCELKQVAGGVEDHVSTEGKEKKGFFWHGVLRPVRAVARAVSSLALGIFAAPAAAFCYGAKAAYFALRSLSQRYFTSSNDGGQESLNIAAKAVKKCWSEALIFLGSLTLIVPLSTAFTLRLISAFVIKEEERKPMLDAMELRYERGLVTTEGKLLPPRSYIEMEEHRPLTQSLDVGEKEENMPPVNELNEKDDNKGIEPSLPSLMPKDVQPASLDVGLESALTTLAGEKIQLKETIECFLANRKNEDRPRGKKLIEKKRFYNQSLLGTERVERQETLELYLLICLERYSRNPDDKRNLHDIQALCDKFNKDCEKLNNQKNSIEGENEITKEKKSKAKKEKEAAEISMFKSNNKQEKKAKEPPTRAEKADWWSSDDIRWRASNKRGPYKDMSFKDIMDNFYMPGLVNFRRQMFIRQDKSAPSRQFLRFGMPTDQSNGWVNYRELKAMQKNETLKDEMIIKLTAKHNKKKNRVKESLSYAIDELKSLDKTVEKRQKILQDQMLMLLWGQVQSGEVEVNNKPFTFVHLGLLNPERRAVDKDSGIATIEANAILDTAEIMEEFRGYKMTFVKDLRAPYLEKGIVYMPASDKQQIGTVSLNPAFFNISTQGYLINDGFCKEINEEGMRHLKEAGIDIDFSFGKETSYRIAIEFADKLLQKEIHLSIACASAKDRTGIVTAKAMENEEVRVLEEIENDKNAVQKYREKIGNRCFEEGEPSTEVVNDCNNMDYLKVTPGMDIPNVSWEKLYINGGKAGWQMFKMGLKKTN